MARVCLLVKIQCKTNKQTNMMQQEDSKSFWKDAASIQVVTAEVLEFMNISEQLVPYKK